MTPLHILKGIMALNRLREVQFWPVLTPEKAEIASNKPAVSAERVFELTVSSPSVDSTSFSLMRSSNITYSLNEWPATPSITFCMSSDLFKTSHVTVQLNSLRPTSLTRPAREHSPLNILQLHPGITVCVTPEAHKYSNDWIRTYWYSTIGINPHYTMNLPEIAGWADHIAFRLQIVGGMKCG